MRPYKKPRLHTVQASLIKRFLRKSNMNYQWFNTLEQLKLQKLLSLLHRASPHFGSKQYDATDAKFGIWAHGQLNIICTLTKKILIIYVPDNKPSCKLNQPPKILRFETLKDCYKNASQICKVEKYRLEYFREAVCCPYYLLSLCSRLPLC